MEGEQAGRLGSSVVFLPLVQGKQHFFSRQSPLHGDQMTWHQEKALDSHCWDVKMLGCENIKSQHEECVC